MNTKLALICLFFITITSIMLAQDFAIANRMIADYKVVPKQAAALIEIMVNPKALFE